MRKLCILLLLTAACTPPLAAGRPAPREAFNAGLYSAGASGGLRAREAVPRTAQSGTENNEDTPPYDLSSSLTLKEDAERIMREAAVKDPVLSERLAGAVSRLGALENRYGSIPAPLPADSLELHSARYELENVLGLVTKGEKALKRARFSRPGEILPASFATQESDPAAKVNTGWILDQKVYDPTVEKIYPTMPLDIRSNDEGASDVEVDDNGWVWQVQSFRFSDPVPDGDGNPTHPTPSYCLAVYLSPDGGSTWLLYEVLYDPSGIDLVNPRLAVDILPSENRFFIAYEYAYSATDHDIYVYSESFSDTPNAQDAPIATSALMERNPDIASDYHQGQTSYRVAAFEKEASAGSHNYDIYASQSTGAGASADWSAALAVAADTGSERNPSLSNGASGSTSFTQYAHLAYNYDAFSASQALLNNGFESGNDGSWTVNSSGDINCGGGYQRTGTCCAWLAGVNSYTDFIYQDVAVPASSVAATLTLYLKITSAEGTTNPYDYLYIQLRDTGNNVLATLRTLSNMDKNTYSTYQPLTLDILPYAGQTLRVYFLATTDSSYITSFFIDDTALNITAPSGHSVRYARAPHPGATPYPDGLQASTKITVLSDMGVGWEYGPPTVAATHGGGGSTGMTPGRVVVAADQHFPADQPNAGDLDRHQLCYAWNMCNGGATCGTMSCSPDTLSLNWQESWFYDPRGDERFPSLVQDGAGLPTSGLAEHPYIYMAYFHRSADSPLELGEVQLILADPSDESCNGFIYGYWYYFTASYTVSDPDNLVSPRARTINAFNYWDGWPGVTFNKNVSHLGGGNNDDVFSSTLGDNYTFHSFGGGQYLNLVVSLDGVTYATSHTFPWAAGYKWDVIAVTPQEESGYYYSFANWSNSQADPKLTVVTDFCDPVNPCPTVDYVASYSRCAIGMSEVQGALAVKTNLEDVTMNWSALPEEISNYAVYVSNDPRLRSGFRVLGTATATTYFDNTSASGPVYYYLVVGQCGPHDGLWGGSYDQ